MITLGTRKKRRRIIFNLVVFFFLVLLFIFICLFSGGAVGGTGGAFGLFGLAHSPHCVLHRRWGTLPAKQIKAGAQGGGLLQHNGHGLPLSLQVHFTTQ